MKNLNPGDMILIPAEVGATPSRPGHVKVVVTDTLGQTYTLDLPPKSVVLASRVAALETLATTATTRESVRSWYDPCSYDDHLRGTVGGANIDKADEEYFTALEAVQLPPRIEAPGNGPSTPEKGVEASL